jgi:hypothetical protein
MSELAPEVFEQARSSSVNSSRVYRKLAAKHHPITRRQHHDDAVNELWQAVRVDVGKLRRCPK